MEMNVVRGAMQIEYLIHDSTAAWIDDHWDRAQTGWAVLPPFLQQTSPNTVGWLMSIKHAEHLHLSSVHEHFVVLSQKHAVMRFSVWVVLIVLSCVMRCSKTCSQNEHSNPNHYLRTVISTNSKRVMRILQLARTSLDAVEMMPLSAVIAVGLLRAVHWARGHVLWVLMIEIDIEI